MGAMAWLPRTLTGSTEPGSGSHLPQASHQAPGQWGMVGSKHLMAYAPQGAFVLTFCNPAFLAGKA